MCQQQQFEVLGIRPGTETHVSGPLWGIFLADTALKAKQKAEAAGWFVLDVNAVESDEVDSCPAEYGFLHGIAAGLILLVLLIGLLGLFSLGFSLFRPSDGCAERRSTANTILPE